MKKVTIVGAGLSGLSAAIILAGQGFSVTVLEQKKEIGGASLHASSLAGRDICFADMTPLDLAAMNRYLGFPLSESAEYAYFSNPMSRLRLRVFGEVIDFDFPADVHMKMVERGHRDTSIDSRLYRLAKEAGVRFSFGAALRSRKDFADLPPGSIIATGMFRHAFEALDIPHTKAYGYFAGGAAPTDKNPFCVAYYHENTRDYAYYASVNGVGAAVLFQRGKPLSVAAMEWFPRQLLEDEGIGFSDWRPIDNIAATPTGSFKNPRLFAGSLILTGTLAGMQDPSMVLGVHGALVSGKIAAMAVTDREAAEKEFARMNKYWKISYFARRFLWFTHPWGPRRLVPAVLKHTPRANQRYMWMLNPAVPGWLRLP